MYCVYWVRDFGTGDEMCCGRICSELDEALKVSEALRKEGKLFVSIASEIPGNVTKMGVDVTGDDYDWKKRRI